MVNLHKKTEDLINQLAKAHNVKKEALVNSLLVLALTDPAFVEKAIQFNKYMGNRGQVDLDNLKL